MLRLSVRWKGMIRLRLDKFLSHAGYGSRKETGAMIRSGRVSLDGRTVRDPGINTCTGMVAVDGVEVQAVTHLYLMMHKPAGILTQAESRNVGSVLDLLPDICVKRKCMPVGRLDKDTTGILLLTTDGVLAHRLISPRRHVDKVYHVSTDSVISEEDRTAFAQGIRLKDFTALPAELRIIGNCEALVTVHEGKYHQIKRMFASRGLNVTRLHREAFGPLSLDPRLQPGMYRELSEEEIFTLYSAAEMEKP